MCCSQAASWGGRGHEIIACRVCCHTCCHECCYLCHVPLYLCHQTGGHAPRPCACVSLLVAVRHGCVPVCRCWRPCAMRHSPPARKATFLLDRCPHFAPVARRCHGRSLPSSPWPAPRPLASTASRRCAEGRAVCRRGFLFFGWGGGGVRLASLRCAARCLACAHCVGSRARRCII